MFICAPNGQKWGRKAPQDTPARGPIQLEPGDDRTDVPTPLRTPDPSPRRPLPPGWRGHPRAPGPFRPRPLHHGRIKGYGDHRDRRGGWSRRGDDLPALFREGRAAERDLPAVPAVGGEDPEGCGGGEGAHRAGPPDEGGAVIGRGSREGPGDLPDVPGGARGAAPRREEPGDRQGVPRRAAAYRGDGEVGWAGAPGAGRPLGRGLARADRLRDEQGRERGLGRRSSPGPAHPRGGVGRYRPEEWGDAAGANVARRGFTGTRTHFTSRTLPPSPARTRSRSPT